MLDVFRHGRLIIAGEQTSIRRRPDDPTGNLNPPHTPPLPALIWNVAAATVVAVVLRAFHLGTQSLWIDETLGWVSAEIGHPWAATALFDDVHGPLFKLLLHAWGGVAGDSEWALRFPSMVFGVTMVPAMAWLAGKWLGRDTAVPAAWLTAASPFLVWYSQEARNYTLLMLCTCLAAAAVLELSRRWSLRRAVMAALSTVAGVLSNFSFLMIAPLLLRWWIGGPSGRGRRVATAAVLAAVLLLVMTPWVPQLARTWDWRRLLPGHAVTAGETPLRGQTTFHPAAVPFALHAFAVGYSLGPSLRELRQSPSSAALARHLPELAVVALVFGLLGLAGLFAIGRRGRLLDAALWFGVPFVTVSWFASQNFKVFHPRYVAVAMPAFLLVLAAGLATLSPRRRLFLSLAVAFLWAAALAQHYFVPEYGKDDYRGAAALVAERARPGEQVLAVGADDPMFYYYRGPLSVERLWLGFAADPNRLELELNEKLAAARGTWVVLSRPEDLDPDGHFARLMDGRVPASGRFTRTGIRIWHVAVP